MSGDLLRGLDLVCLLLATVVTNIVYQSVLVPVGLRVPLDMGSAAAAFLPALLAPVLLHNRNFGSIASRGRHLSLATSHGARFSVFTGVLLTLGALTGTLQTTPALWLVIWFGLALLLTGTTRLVAARGVRGMQRNGVLTEVIAVVGTGAAADRLVQALQRARPGTLEVLGVFDDRGRNDASGQILRCGDLAELIALGATRKIDWILLSLPATAKPRLSAIVRRLKALSAPIALCPQHDDPSGNYMRLDHFIGSVGVSSLPWQDQELADSRRAQLLSMLPRWLATVGRLPRQLLMQRHERSMKTVPRELVFDGYDLDAFTAVATQYGSSRFGYVVTPNADHVIRLERDASFRRLYASAAFVLLDSRFMAMILRWTRGIQLPVCTGSDLTARLFAGVLGPNDRVLLVGGTPAQAKLLASQHGLLDLHHHNPPMGFIHKPQAVTECLDFIEALSPFRFCLLAIGSPQQEVIAQQLQQRDRARGLCLCVGASINFITGVEQRAPGWMQGLGLEWLYRLLQSPARMSHRYLVRGPRIFAILASRRIRLRAALNAPAAQPRPVAALPAH